MNRKKIIYVCSPLAPREHDRVDYSMEDNITLARKLCRAVATLHLLRDDGVINREEVEAAQFIPLPKVLVERPETTIYIPIAPHVYFTTFLDDTLAEERMLGMEHGLTALGLAQELWVYSKRGVSTGMKREIEAASNWGRPDLDRPRNMPVTFDPPCWEGL